MQIYRFKLIRFEKTFVQKKRNLRAIQNLAQISFERLLT